MKKLAGRIAAHAAIRSGGAGVLSGSGGPECPGRPEFPVPVIEFQG